MSSTSSGTRISASSLTSCMISAIGKSGARSSGPTGSPVPGWSTGCAGFGMSARTLYQAFGISFSPSTNFVCGMGRTLHVAVLAPGLGEVVDVLTAAPLRPGDPDRDRPEDHQRRHVAGADRARLIGQVDRVHRQPVDADATAAEDLL